MNAFTHITNREGYDVKPWGGLWASPFDADYSWKRWCIENEFKQERLATSFEFSITGRVLVIDSFREFIRRMTFRTGEGFIYDVSPDFERMICEGVDAIHLTERGFSETHLSHPGLYGWDCECVLIMNPLIVKPAIVGVREDALRSQCASIA